jgi:hypothetical protein
MRPVSRGAGRFLVWLECVRCMCAVGGGGDALECVRCLRGRASAAVCLNACAGWAGRSRRRLGPVALECVRYLRPHAPPPASTSDPAARAPYRLDNDSIVGSPSRGIATRVGGWRGGATTVAGGAMPRLGLGHGWCAARAIRVWRSCRAAVIPRSRWWGAAPWRGCARSFGLCNPKTRKTKQPQHQAQDARASPLSLSGALAWCSDRRRWVVGSMLGAAGATIEC